MRLFGRSEEILHNPGLTKAVGTAIALVINAIAEDKQYHDCKQNLQKLAPAAVTFWLDTKGEILLASEATEIGGHKNLSAVFSKNAEEFAKYEALSLESWQHILKAIGEQAQVSLPTEVINSIAELMLHTFPQALREVLKEDAEKGGKAYVEMIILLTGEIVSTTKQLDVRLQNSHQELVNRLENLQASLINSASTTEEVLKDWFSEVESGINEVLSKLSLSGERIETLLKEMTGKMSQLEAQINQYLPHIQNLNFINSDNYQKYPEIYDSMFTLLKEQFNKVEKGGFIKDLMDELKSGFSEDTKPTVWRILEGQIKKDVGFASKFISLLKQLEEARVISRDLPGNTPHQKVTVSNKLNNSHGNTISQVGISNQTNN